MTSTMTTGRSIAAGDRLCRQCADPHPFLLAQRTRDVRAGRTRHGAFFRRNVRRRKHGQSLRGG